MPRTAAKPATAPSFAWVSFPKAVALTEAHFRDGMTLFRRSDGWDITMPAPGLVRLRHTERGVDLAVWRSEFTLSHV